MDPSECPDHEHSPLKFLFYRYSLLYMLTSYDGALMIPHLVMVSSCVELILSLLFSRIFPLSMLSSYYFFFAFD